MERGKQIETWQIDEKIKTCMEKDKFYKNGLLKGGKNSLSYCDGKPLWSYRQILTIPS